MMLAIDVNASKQRFIKRLKSGYFTVERSQNNEDNYSDAKEKRDTEAVEAFLSTDLAKEFIKMK